jgi:6-pyruvoyltetrahydropterin/6-carboxytetrahydropterin synthase
MIIHKQYKFYAAHRNEELADKCRNLHGHRYGIDCFFEVERGEGSTSTLFGDFDAVVEPHLKRHYDHGLLINRHDPLFATLQDHMQRTGEDLMLCVFDEPTSVENLAFKLFGEITAMGFTLSRLEVRETDTSVLIYTHADWVADERRRAERIRTESLATVS